MRILQVVPRLSQKYGGGGVVIAKNLSQELARRGHEVDILTSDYGIDADLVVSEYLEKFGILVEVLKTKLSLATLHITEAPRGLASCYLEGIYNIIHMQSCRTFQNIIVYHYAKKYNVPYIVDSHGFSVEGTWLRKISIKIFDGLFANKICRNAKFCVAETGTGVKEFLRAGVNRKKIVVIPAPYDLSIFDSLPKKGQFRRKNKRCGAKRIVLFLGGLEYIKGLDFLVKVFARLDDKNTVLVLVGEDMGYKKTLEKMIDGLGIKGKVIFTGGLYGQEKLEALVDADVAVFPSRAEQGLPFAALEAIMCNTPVIVTDGTGAAEDIEKMNGGFVVPFGDKYRLGNLLLSIMKNPFSTREVLSQQSNLKGMQEYIRKNLSITEKVKDYEKLYKRCL